MVTGVDRFAFELVRLRPQNSLVRNRLPHYRKRGSASYIVREVLSVRERERYRQRERETERDGSDVTIVALNWR